MGVLFGTGDLFCTEADAYAHGCNCAGAMGAGIAVEFKFRHPTMFRTYKQLCFDDKFKLGSVLEWDAEDYVVFNLGTQEHWKMGAELWAVKRGLTRMIELAEQRGLVTIALPRIGAGLGGLPWKDVREVLETLGTQTEVNLLVAEFFEKGASICDANKNHQIQINQNNRNSK